MSGNESKSGLIRSIGGWNNTSMSKRTNPTNGRLARDISLSLRTTGGGIPNPSLGIGTIRIAMPQNAAGSYRPSGVVRISGADGDPNATTFRQNPTFTTRIAQITASFIQTVLPANNITALNTVEIGNLVTSIGAGAFTSASNSLTSLTFKQFENARLRTIDTDAFSGCDSIAETLRIPGLVTSIGDRAFGGLGSLASIDLVSAAALVSIGNFAFQNCRSATGTLAIPGSVATIGTGAFFNCDSLASIDLANADALVSIGNFAFFACISAAGTLTIPSSVTSIGFNAFDNCTSLNEVSFVSSTQPVTIANNAFARLTLIAGGTRLSNLSGTLDRNVPGGINFYPPASDSLFRSGTNATGASVALINSTLVSNAKSNLGGSMDTATVGALVTEIGASAFTGVAGSLTELSFRSGGVLAGIGDRAFSGCGSLASIDLANATSLVSIQRFAFSGCRSASGPLIIPGSVTLIRPQAFNNCESLVSIELANANALVSIQDAAFANLSNATGALRIPDSVATIDTAAFANCTSLASIDLANAAALVSIGNLAFQNCRSATGTLAIPGSVATIERSAFNGCTSLTEISFVSSGVPSASVVSFPSNSPFNGLNFVSDGSALEGLSEIDRRSGPVVFFRETQNTRFFKADRTAQETTNAVLIDQNIVSTANLELFNELAIAEIGTQVTEIGASAFGNAQNSLTELSFRSGGVLATIGQIAFNGCGSLASIDLASATALQLIDQSAFINCVRATGALRIPGSVATIGADAFAECGSLASINLVSAAALVNIQQGAFVNCASATGALTIPGSVATIGNVGFRGCTSLSAISFVSSSVPSASVVRFPSGSNSPFVNLGFTNASLGSLQTLLSVNRGSGAVVFTKAQ